MSERRGAATVLTRDHRSPGAVRVLDRTAGRVGAEGQEVLEAVAILAGMVDARTAPLLERRMRGLRERAEREPEAPREALAPAAYGAGLSIAPATP